MDEAIDKSIEEIIERARKEKEDIIKYIDSLVAYRLPEIIENSKRTNELCSNFASKLEIGFNPNQELKDLMELYTEKLNALKKDLEGFEINEENLLGNETSILEQAQEVVQLIEPAIEKVKTNFYISNQGAILKPYEQREKIQSKIKENEPKITDLKIQKAYLQGQLESTKNTKKREELERKIKWIDEDIRNYGEKILNLEIQKEYVLNQKNGERKPVDSQMVTDIKDKEPNGQEPDDDIIDK